MFRLYLENQNIVTNISEALSAEALEAEMAGAVELTLPRLVLMPNRLSVYVWLGRDDVSWMKAGKQFGYDVIDANIDLPTLTIARPRPSKRRTSWNYLGRARARKHRMERSVTCARNLTKFSKRPNCSF